MSAPGPSKGDDSSVDLKLLKQLGLGHVIKRMRTRKDGTREIEFESRLPALIKLGQYFQLCINHDELRKLLAEA